MTAAKSQGQKTARAASPSSSRDASRGAGGEWQIAQTSKQCMHCGTRFLPGQDYWSTLHVEPGGELPILVRQDACDECWQPQDDRIYWKTRRAVDKGDRNVVDIQAMHQLFLQLLEDERDEIEALRYVVGLMLVRKKVLKIVRNVGGARGDLVFRDPRDAEKRLRLPTPELSDGKLELLKSQLGDILT